MSNHDQSDDSFNYSQVDVEAIGQLVEKCFDKNAQGKRDPIAIGMIDMLATLMRELIAPVKQRQKIFLAVFSGLTVGLAWVLILTGWPQVRYPTAILIIGLVTIAAIAQTVSKIIFRAKVERVIIGANTWGVILEWLVEQRPDLRYILDDLSAAGLPLRQVIRRFVTHRPTGAVPPEIVAEMRNRMNADRRELFS